MDRQQRRDLKHDKFVDEIGSLSTRARENQRLLLTITAAAVILAILVYGIYFYRANHEQKGQDALAKAIETNESPLLPAPGAQPVPGAKFKTAAERSAAAEKQFKDVETIAGGSDAAQAIRMARTAAAPAASAIPAVSAPVNQAAAPRPSPAPATPPTSPSPAPSSATSRVSWLSRQPVARSVAISALRSRRLRYNTSATASPPSTRIHAKLRCQRRAAERLRRWR